VKELLTYTHSNLSTSVSGAVYLCVFDWVCVGWLALAYAGVFGGDGCIIVLGMMLYLSFVFLFWFSFVFEWLVFCLLPLLWQ
jgi:hypothetical protein